MISQIEFEYWQISPNRQHCNLPILGPRSILHHQLIQASYAATFCDNAVLLSHTDIQAKWITPTSAVVQCNDQTIFTTERRLFHTS